MSLKEKAISGFGWTSLEGILSQGVIFIVMIVLARLLTPQDFGIIGIITVFVAITSTLVEGGFSDALIRKTKVNDLDFNTVFYINLIVSILLYVLLYVCSGVIAGYFEQPSLEKILKYSGVIIIINSFTITQIAELTIKLNFRLLSSIRIVSSIISSIIAIIMAYNNYGVWSLVMLNIMRPLINCILLWTFNTWRPQLLFSIKSFKDLFDFGYKILTTKIINTIYKNIYYFLIGKYFSPTSLGYYTRADQFQAPFSVNIARAISGISYPILAKQQDNIPQLKRIFRKFLKFSVIVNFTIIIAIAATAKPLILLTIGEKWEQSIIYLQLLCIPGMLYPLQILNLNLLTALGYSNLLLKLELVKKVILIPLIILTASFSINIMLYGLILFAVIEYFINAHYSKKLINYSISQQLIDILPSMIISAILFVLIYPISLLELSLMSMIFLQLFLGLAFFIFLNELANQNEYVEIKARVILGFKKIIK